MYGRSRRASTSTVESECEADIRWRQESSVVRTVSKDMTPNDWPIFELANAIVLDKHGQTMENALLVSKRGPFIVRGHLIIDDPSQKSHLIMRARPSTPLEIRSSVLYSIGESDDGRPLIWVSGQGGWYEIDPCRAYKPIYAKMCEATTMYYTLLDIYTEQSSGKAKKSQATTIMEELGPVFHKYAVRIGDGSTIEEVFARAHEHAAFFIDKISQNDDPLDWSTTAFYKYVCSQVSEQARATPTALAPGPSSRPLQQDARLSDADYSTRVNVQTPAIAVINRGGSSGSIAAKDDESCRGQRGGTEKSRNSIPRTVGKRTPSERSFVSPFASPPLATNHPIIPLYEPSDKDDAPNSPLQSALAVMDCCFDALANSRTGMTLINTLTYLYFHYTLPSYKDERVGSYKQPAEEWLHYYSKAMLPLLDDSFRHHELYSDLQFLANSDLKLLSWKPSDFPLVIRARNTVQRRGSTTRAVRRRAPSFPAPTPSNIDTSNHNIAASDGPRPIGKRPTRTPHKSSLQPIGGPPKKRLRTDFEDEDSDSDFAGQDEDSYYYDDGDSVDQELHLRGVQPTDSADEDGVAQGFQDEDGVERTRLVIRAEKIPNMTPRGPDDTWTCDQEGCDYVVRGSSEQDSHERIQQHFRVHEQQLSRMQLAMKEGARGHMPVNHLLDKIKNLQGEATDPPYQPIKRKLIV
ncbi:hypothetical protein E4U19_004827 [Claviceps sp. Clav32 group G5]|nr:hypothetical protein E4U19_004827 [Claviceps sp. Clav32 group G5]KAG6046089.1 hypothetical protein E4U39_001644 [Claviceps sp. Clav50 group G5]